MIDFKKILQERYNKLTDEEKEEYKRIEKLKKENTFYKTITFLDDDKNPQVTLEQEVVLYKPVINGELIEKILISFGGYREYNFDENLCKNILNNLKTNKDSRFCIDVGKKIFVKNSELIRIFKESLSILKKLNIKIKKDN